jgi:hypothetical protein
MLELRRLLPIDAAFRISLPLEDSKLIASNVSAGQWAVVADTLAALETFASQDTLEGLKDANVALQPLVRSG